MKPLSFASHTHFTAKDVDDFGIAKRKTFSETKAQQIADEMANSDELQKDEYANQHHKTL